MIGESAVREFDYSPVRAFRFERYYNKNGRKMWQAACQFDVTVRLDPDLDPLERASIEYRQFIRGGVWIRRGTQAWAVEANGNKYFPIPPYGGQSRAEGIPKGAVSGTGLSLYWKEDGQLESGGTECYGYRDTAEVDAANEKDIWKYPDALSGHTYRLRDTPSVAGEWGSGDSVEVWIELYFKGFVVEIDRDGGPTFPVRVLKKKTWECFWQAKKLTLWMDATEIPTGSG